MTKSELQVAIVGAGRMGRARAQAAADFGATVRFVCDSDRETAASLSDAYSASDCKAVALPTEVDWSVLDAIFICTPPAARGEVELMAIENGVPFLVEKPAGLSAAAVQDIEQALQERPTINAVGYMNRYRKSVQTVRQQIANTKILGMSADWLVGMYGVPWWADKSGSGGPVNEQATHLVDLARYLVGEIESVQATSVSIPNKPELIGTAAINLRFENGQLGSILYSCRASEKMIRFHVYMEDRDAVLTGWDFHLAGDDSTIVEYANRNEIFSTEVNAFLRSVSASDSRAILCDFQEAMATQRVVDAIHRAVVSGSEEAVESPK